jgi:signal transduction histidine kinase
MIELAPAPLTFTPVAGPNRIQTKPLDGHRVDKAGSREQGGAGLGLSIARSIVAASAAAIELNRVPGLGLLCTVTLPHTTAT